MTKRQLLQLLQDVDNDDEIMIACNSNDYWDTVLVCEPQFVDEEIVEYSGYHESEVITNTDESDETRRVFVIYTDRKYYGSED